MEEFGSPQALSIRPDIAWEEAYVPRQILVLRPAYMYNHRELPKDLT